jgi:hypothetical protein
VFRSGSESGSTCFWVSQVWIRIRLWIRILLSSCKNSKKNLDSYYFVTLFDFLSLKNDVNVPLKSIKRKNFCWKISFLLASWRSMTKIAGSGSRIRIRIQIHWEAWIRPQNLMDPQHWCKFIENYVIVFVENGVHNSWWLFFKMLDAL